MLKPLTIDEFVQSDTQTQNVSGTNDAKAMTIEEFATKKTTSPISQEPKERKQGIIESIGRGIVSPVTTMIARPFQLGAELLGASTESVDKFSDKYSGGLVAPTPKNTGDLFKDVGRGLETVALGIGGGGIKAAGKEVLKGATKQAIKQGVKEGAIAGGVGGFGSGLEQGQDLTSSLKSGAIGSLVGAGLGGALGGGASVIKNKLSPSKDVLTTKLDDSIRSIFKDTTGDVNKINESAFKAKKGLELLTKESRDLSIPDIKAPLGSKTTKPFDIKKATPNELLSSVLEMDKKIATNARKAVETAKQQGLKIDTFEAESLINKAVKNGEIPKATGTRMLQQIKTAGDDPVKIHDWVQEINTRYGKKYQRGTIDDTALGKVADDVAEIFRNKLDVIVDRKGYAEAFSNNQELKRMLVAIAKKANKNVNFGDIQSDAGLDLGISILTGNPAYMARTIGTSLFKGLLSNIRHQSGLREFKSAASTASKLPTETKLPSTKTKPQIPQLRLEAPKKDALRSEIKSSIPMKVAPTGKNMELTSKTGIVPNKQSGFSKTGTILSGAGALSLGVGAKKLSNKPSEAIKQKETEPTKFLNAIAYNETNTIKDPYSYSKFSGSKELGDDLGKYQVTEGELKTYGKRYLGYIPTKQQFLSSPELQDEYMTNKYNYLKTEGYSDAEIADIHRKGIKNARPKGKDTYQSPEYVKPFLANLK